jgi:hypothetical protein
MEKKSPSILLVTVIVIATALVIPMLPGITAAENDNNIQPSQWCCSDKEDEKDNSQTISIPNIKIDSNFHI